jgi:hypothetical protein
MLVPFGMLVNNATLENWKRYHPVPINIEYVINNIFNKSLQMG